MQIWLFCIDTPYTVNVESILVWNQEIENLQEVAKVTQHEARARNSIILSTYHLSRGLGH